MTTDFNPPNNQNDAAAAIPVWITRGSGSGAIDGTPLGYQQITSLTAATALTVPAGATSAVVEAEAQAVRWRDDGTAPTATVGMLLAAGSSLTFSGDLAVVEFIGATAGAILNVSYYK